MTLDQNSEFYIHQLKEFDEFINAPHDLLIFVLRFHLLAENMLERIIIDSLPRGANLANKARLSFVQKLAVVDALGILDENLTVSLERLNSLRNKCAHKPKMKVTLKEIDSISEPFGEKLSTVRPDPDQDPKHVELNAAVLATTFFGSHIFAKLALVLLPLESHESL